MKLLSSEHQNCAVSVFVELPNLKAGVYLEIGFLEQRRSLSGDLFTCNRNMPQVRNLPPELSLTSKS